MLIAVWTAQRESVEVVTGLAAKTASKSVKSASERIGVPKRIRMVGARQIKTCNPAADSTEGLSFMVLLLTFGAIPFDTPLLSSAVVSNGLIPDNSGRQNSKSIAATRPESYRTVHLRRSAR